MGVRELDGLTLVSPVCSGKRGGSSGMLTEPMGGLYSVKGGMRSVGERDGEGEGG